MLQEAASSTLCFKDLFYFFIRVYYTPLCIYHLCLGAHRGHKGTLDPLELELQAVAYVGARNKIQVLSKSSQCP